MTSARSRAAIGPTSGKERAGPQPKPRWRVAHKGGVGHFLGVARTAKGSPRWWDVQVTLIPASDGASGKLLSISRDITQDRERQLALDEQNARLKLLSDTASQLIGGCDPNIVLETLFQAAAVHLDLDVCLHLTVDAVGALRLQSCVGVAPDEAARLARLDPGETICGWVARNPAIVVPCGCSGVPDAHAHEVQGLGVQAYACNPLIANGELLGTLSFGSRKRATFSAEDLAFFRTISTYVAVIKERQRAEAELKETEARLRLAVEAAAIGIFDHDLTNGVLRWDARTKELFGLPPEAEVSYEGTFLARLHPEDREAADRAVQDAVDLAGPGIFDIEFRTIDPLDGRTRWIAARGRAVREHGRTIRFIGTVRDITESRQAGDALKETVERYRLVTRATNDLIWDWDLVANHLLWNEALYTAYGYIPDNVGTTGEWWISRIHPDDRERVEQDIHAVIDGMANEWSHEYRFLRASGQYADVLDRSYMVRSPTGAPLRMIGAVLDITGRKRAEQQLRLLHRELGHRLKNVLTMAQAIATQTLRNAGSMEEARDTLAARLVTMGRAQDVLIAGTADGADILTVLKSALEPHGDPQMDRFRLRGPTGTAQPQRGSLPVLFWCMNWPPTLSSTGRSRCHREMFDLIWNLTTDDQEPCLVLSWSEYGGPPVVAPSRKGFGTRLITRGLAGDVGGKVQIDYATTGVVCTLTAPLAELTEPR